MISKTISELKRSSAAVQLALVSCLFVSQACPAQDNSLIEQALDAKAEPAQGSGKSDSLLPAPEKPKTESSLSKTQEALEKKRKHSVRKKKDEQDSYKNNSLPEAPIPEPKEIMEPPIHSTLPASIPSVLGLFQVGDTKIGKSFAIDPAYRGKPALTSQPTVTFGSVPWAIPQKKQIAAVPAAIPQSPTQGSTALPAATGLQNKQVSLCTVNVRFQTPQSSQRKDSVWAYPYPPKPPKPAVISPLPEDEATLKNMILSSGYSYRPDLRQPYPSGGWRWVHAFETAKKKSGLGTPHTMITMYPWTNKMFPYVFAECHELNSVEEQRFLLYDKIKENYERVHTDLESQAAAKGLFPLEIKINSRGIGQLQLPEGNWWITATRKTPGLKFYWQIPVSCGKGQSVNVQMTEANALIIAGGW